MLLISSWYKLSDRWCRYAASFMVITIALSPKFYLQFSSNFGLNKLVFLLFGVNSSTIGASIQIFFLIMISAMIPFQKLTHGILIKFQIQSKHIISCCSLNFGVNHLNGDSVVLHFFGSTKIFAIEENLAIATSDYFWNVIGFYWRSNVAGPMQWNGSSAWFTESSELLFKL